MKRSLLHIIPALALMLAGCIENNVPYPLVVPSISEIEVEGAISLDINAAQMTITAALQEQTDIHRVKVAKLQLDNDITKVVPPMTGTWDLSTPKNFLFKNYREYNWKLCATQEIERYFTVNGQVGASVMDVANHRVFVKVAKKIRLDRISVQSMKLGPADITEYSKTMDQITNLENGETVEISYHNQVETWTIYAENTESSIDIKAVNAWTRTAWVEANGIQGQTNGVRYRPSGSEQWLEAEIVAQEGGSFTACITGLEPLAVYEYHAYSGSEQTAVGQFTTEKEETIPNAGLNVYSKAESDKYFSFFDPAHSLWSSKWWDNGNVGSTAVGESGIICAPDPGDKAEGEASARLNSKYVVIKFAAGNLFTGEFAGLVGTKGGKVNFGRPWTTRPRALRLMIKHNCGSIDYVDEMPAGTNLKIGDPDAAEIFIALGDWDYKEYGGTAQSPVQVNTTDKSTLFNPASPGIIAYGNYTSQQSTGGWTQIEIPLEYRSLSRKPTHIVISCASSKYGDYFTGSSQSTLWVDDFQLVY